MPIFCLAIKLLSAESFNDQESFKSLTEYCLLYKKGIINWNNPKVTIEKIKCKTPIKISPLKMGTKKLKKK